MAVAWVAACAEVPVKQPVDDPALCAYFADDMARAAAGEAELTGDGSGGRQQWQVSGSVLHVRSSGPLTLGVVADARGTTEHLGTIRARFAERGVDVVVTLGGMGRDARELRAVLAALSEAASWPVVAMPGNDEALAAHREVTAGLAGSGVVDGSVVRLIGNDVVMMGTLPGAAHASLSAARREGCVYTLVDAAELARRLRQVSGVRVLLTHAPPRQRGADATDMGIGQVHMGDAALAEAAATAQVHLVVHGLVPRAPWRQSGRRAVQLDGPVPVVLSAGAADGAVVPVGPLDMPHVALVVMIAAGEVSWTEVVR